MTVPQTARQDAGLPEGQQIQPFSWVGFWDFRRVNPARSMICFAIGATVGLGIAGVGLFTAKGTATHVVPPENVALVNQRPHDPALADFIAQTEVETSKPFGEALHARRAPQGVH